MPTGKSTAVRMFGKTDALNVVSEEYGYNDKLIGLYIFAATDNTKSGEKPADKTDSSAADNSSADSSAPDGSSAAEDSSSEVEKAAASVIGRHTDSFLRRLGSSRCADSFPYRPQEERRQGSIVF